MLNISGNIIKTNSSKEDLYYHFSKLFNIFSVNIVLNSATTLPYLFASLT